MLICACVKITRGEKSSGVGCVDWDPICLLMDREPTRFQFSWFLNNESSMVSGTNILQVRVGEFLEWLDV